MDIITSIIEYYIVLSTILYTLVLISIIVIYDSIPYEYIYQYYYYGMNRYKRLVYSPIS